MVEEEAEYEVEPDAEAMAEYGDGLAQVRPRHPRLSAESNGDCTTKSNFPRQPTYSVLRRAAPPQSRERERSLQHLPPIRVLLEYAPEPPLPFLSLWLPPMKRVELEP